MTHSISTVTDRLRNNLYLPKCWNTHERLSVHLNQNDILTENQHGFQWNKSTIATLDSYHNNLLNKIDAGECFVGIFCNLTKAFDCQS